MIVINFNFKKKKNIFNKLFPIVLLTVLILRGNNVLPQYVINSFINK